MTPCKACLKKKEQIEYIATQDIPIFGISKGTIIKYEKSSYVIIIEAEDYIFLSSLLFCLCLLGIIIFLLDFICLLFNLFHLFFFKKVFFLKFSANKDNERPFVI